MPAATLPRPAERVAIISLILVFLCGTALGAAVMSYVWHGQDRRGDPGVHLSGSPSLSTAEWQEKLDLTSDQVRQLDSILDDFSRYYDNLLADGKTRIKQILNPAQRRKFEQMMKEHRR